MKKNYELMLIIKDRINEELKKDIVAMAHDTISSVGEVLKEDVLGSRKLAYPINKEYSGFYVVLNFKCEPTIIKELDRKLRISENVIRHLTIQLTEEELTYALNRSNKKHKSEGKDMNDVKDEKDGKKEVVNENVSDEVTNESQIEENENKNADVVSVEPVDKLKEETKKLNIASDVKLEDDVDPINENAFHDEEERVSKKLGLSNELSVEGADVKQDKIDLENTGEEYNNKGEGNE